MIECKICNQKFKNINCLIWHLRGHFISYQDYLKTYIWKPFKYFEFDTIPGICPICKKEFKLKMIYQQIFCCKKCQNIFYKTSELHKKKVLENYTNTCLKKYGVENAAKLESVREKIKINQKLGSPKKIKKIKIKKEKPLDLLTSTEKIKRTKMEKYGDPNYNNFEKTKKTNLEKYGVEYTVQNETIKNNIKLSVIERYGVDSPMKIGEVKEKLKQTNLKKYGVENYMQTQEYKEKCYASKKLHNTFHTSKSEMKLYKLLEEKFGIDDIEYQYRSNLYPFACDFYIKSLDLYIELQGTWLHGGEQFDPKNPDHILKLNKWKSKNTKFYQNAVSVWTIRDPLKRKTALENNLNYIEVFDSKNFKELDFIFKDSNIN